MRVAEAIELDERTEREPTLQQMLAAVDPKKHGGNVMDGGPVDVEAFAHGNA